MRGRYPPRLGKSSFSDRSAGLIVATVVYVNAVGGERAALVRDGELVELFVDADPSQPQSGDICFARVVKDAPALNACFVDAGFGQDVFVEDKREAGGRPRPGNELIIQVRRPPQGHKAAHAARTIELAGRYVVFSPTSHELKLSPRLPADQREPSLWAARVENARGITIRTAAAGAAVEEIVVEAEALRATWQDIERDASGGGRPRILHRDDRPLRRVAREWADCDRIVVDDENALASLRQLVKGQQAPRLELYDGSSPLFVEAGIEAQIQRGLSPDVKLDDGSWVKIEEGETLTAIDVNTGGNLETPDLVRRTNGLAAARIAIELRRRNIAGIVVIDFLKTRAADRRHAEDALRRACASDPAQPRIFGTSAVGLVELVRPRRGVSVRAAYQRSCVGCGGSGSELSERAAGRDILRQLEWAVRRHNDAAELVIETPPGLQTRVVEQIEPSLRELERRAGMRIRSERSDGAKPSEAARIRAVFRSPSR